MTRFLEHQNFLSLNDAKQQLNVYSSPTRIVEVLEIVVETRNFLSREDLMKLLKDCPILVSEYGDMYRVVSIHPSQNKFKLKSQQTSSLYVCSLEEAYITNGKLSIKDITGRRFEYSYFKHTLLD